MSAIASYMAARETGSLLFWLRSLARERRPPPRWRKFFEVSGHAGPNGAAESNAGVPRLLNRAHSIASNHDDCGR